MLIRCMKGSYQLGPDLQSMSVHPDTKSYLKRNKQPLHIMWAEYVAKCNTYYDLIAGAISSTVKPRDSQMLSIYCGTSPSNWAFGHLLKIIINCSVITPQYFREWEYNRSKAIRKERKDLE